MNQESSPNLSDQDAAEVTAARRTPTGPTSEPTRPPGGRLWKRVVLATATVLVVYLAVAYLVMPALWVRYSHRHPSFGDVPNITRTGNGIPGDPINVSLIGSEDDLKKAMLAAKWYPADPLTLRSCLKIAADTVLKRPDERAPVSNLYLFGRREDLAFEQPVDNNPRQRHHVRFWRSDQVVDGQPVWMGSAVYDDRVGLSRDTGQITHHTAADIDAERDKLFHDLEQTGDLSEVYFVDDFHKEHKGKNGGGDPWFTDGRLEVGVLRTQ